MRSSRSAWRSEHLCSDFGLPRPARPESIEACDRAAKPGARALAAVRNAPDAQPFTPAAPRAVQQASFGKQLAYLATATTRCRTSLLTASMCNGTTQKAPIWRETSKCGAAADEFWSRAWLCNMSAGGSQMAGPVLDQPPETSFQRSESRRAAQSQFANATTKNPPHSAVPPFRGLHCSYRVFRGILRHK